MNVFAAASKGLSLTPAQRSFLKLIEGFLLAGLLSAATAAVQVLAQQNVNQQVVLEVAGGSFGVAFLMAVSKYYKAHGDPALAQVASDAAAAIPAPSGLPLIPAPVSAQ